MDENEQFDVKEEICMNICSGEDHKCMDHDADNKLRGVDVEKIRDDYNNSRKEQAGAELCQAQQSTGWELASHSSNSHLARLLFRMAGWPDGLQ